MSTSVFEVEIKDQDTAVSVLRYFLDTAAKRGAYSIPEAARIMEALTFFEKSSSQPTDKST